MGILYFMRFKAKRDSKPTVKKIVRWDTLHKEGVPPDFDNTEFMLFFFSAFASPYDVGSLPPFLRARVP